MRNYAIGGGSTVVIAPWGAMRDRIPGAGAFGKGGSRSEGDSEPPADDKPIKSPAAEIRQRQDHNQR